MTEGQCRRGSHFRLLSLSLAFWEVGLEELSKSEWGKARKLAIFKIKAPPPSFLGRSLAGGGRERENAFLES